MKIIINGKEYTFKSSPVTYDQICVLGIGKDYYYMVDYTVTYSYGKDSDKKGGTLVPGQIKHLENGMIFNVALI